MVKNRWLSKSSMEPTDGPRSGSRRTRNQYVIQEWIVVIVQEPSTFEFVLLYLDLVKTDGVVTILPYHNKFLDDIQQNEFQRQTFLHNCDNSLLNDTCTNFYYLYHDHGSTLRVLSQRCFLLRPIHTLEFKRLSVYFFHFLRILIKIIQNMLGNTGFIIKLYISHPFNSTKV